MGERLGVDLWKAIKREWDVMGGNVIFFMGNGRRVRFWKDRWYGDDPLCTSFPSLFAISSSKEAWVEDIWNHSGGEFRILISLCDTTIGR